MRGVEVVLLFGKAPVRGAVKTRLAATLGDDEALAVYTATTASIVRAITPADRTWDAVFVVTPDDADPAIRDWLPSLDAVWPQGHGDLGARLARATERAFALGYTAVTLVGTDCPAVTAPVLREAFAALSAHDAVLGPATDGGYWLLAMRAPLAVFDDIAWSTDTVAEATRDRLRREGASLHELAEARDLDTEDDLRWWRKRGF